MDIIIGAGITGLTYANFTQNDYTILEADDHIGGLCNTIKQDGFVWDYSGHFFHFTDPKIAEYISERIDKTNLLQIEKCTQIKYKDRLIDFPFQKNIHQLEHAEFIDCLCDLFENRPSEFANFSEMLYAKFGKSIAEKFLIPYNSKLYAIDLNNLDANAMGRFFPYVDKEDIVRNFRKNNNASYNGHFLYHRGGAIEYVNAMAKQIPSTKISLNEQVVDIDTSNKIVHTNKRSLSYDHIVSTIPLNALLPLCHIVHDTKALTCNKVLVYNLGFDLPSNDKKNHWIYFPEDKYCFYRVGFYSNIIKGDRMSLYVEVGLKSDEQIDKNAQLQKVLDDLMLAGIVTTQKLVSWHSVEMNPAYVHISQKGIQESHRCKQILSEAGIYSIGRYGSWNYSSIEDNMKEAIALSQQI